MEKEFDVDSNDGVNNNNRQRGEHTELKLSLVLLVLMTAVNFFFPPKQGNSINQKPSENRMNPQNQNIREDKGSRKPEIDTDSSKRQSQVHYLDWQDTRTKEQKINSSFSSNQNDLIEFPTIAAYRKSYYVPQAHVIAQQAC